AERVAEHFEGICLGEVRRYELPNLGALNFILDSALAGGGTSSLRVDAQGKAMGEALLLMEIDA
ncbi:AtuA-related protein, partial [Rhodococcus gordoniae]|uniref:AtuA-related protein n=2 Tax=Nocardiaceae TaxID=85025 RepID=UPI003F981645